MLFAGAEQDDLLAERGFGDMLRGVTRIDDNIRMAHDEIVIVLRVVGRDNDKIGIAERLFGEGLRGEIAALDP